MNEALERAIRCLAIRDIWLRRTSLVVDEDYDPKFQEETYRVQLRHRLLDVRVLRKDPANSPNSESGIVRFRLDTGVRLIPRHEEQNEDAVADDSSAQPDPVVRATLEAEFVAEYRITDSNIPDEEALSEFGQSNAMYHVWPYWREHVQNLASRARLPEIVLPMFRVPKENRPTTGSGDGD